MALMMFDVAAAGLTTVTTAYTSGDMVGTMSTLDLGSGYGASRRGGYVVGAVVHDDSDVLGAIDLLFFSATATQAADNAAASWSDADAKNLCGVMSLTTIQDYALNKVLVAANAEQRIPFVANTGSLYMSVITRTGNAVFAAGATSVNYRLFLEI
jgi:hypothetical protein